MNSVLDDEVEEDYVQYTVDTPLQRLINEMAKIPPSNYVVINLRLRQIPRLLMPKT